MTGTTDSTRAEEPARNAVPDVALVLEGGGMRAAYTSAVVEALIRERIDLGWVGGISAGATMLTNYLSRDLRRTRGCFVEMSADKRYGGWGTFVRGRGYFDSQYIYETAPLPGELAPYDYDAYRANPTPAKVGAVRADDGEMVWWDRSDMAELRDLMVRVRASSTMPGFMVPPVIDGVAYVDGAMGPDGGIPVDEAERDGFDRFLVVMTQQRDYRKPEVSRPGALRRVFRRTPAVAQAMIDRPANYNRTREKLLELERQGRAYLFFPEHMTLTNRTRDMGALQAAYAAGRGQIARELPAIREFLGLA
ncbi:patatin-like phospholipase family protein [Corynebacterium sp. 335C]